MGKELVRCCVCVNEKDSFCSIKKCKVKLKKNRKCEEFIYDVSKVKVKRPLPSDKVPYKLIDRDLRRKEAKKLLKELKEKQLLDKYIDTSIDKREKVANSSLRGVNNSAFMIDDLSAFKTTSDE